MNTDTAKNVIEKTKIFLISVFQRLHAFSKQHKQLSAALGILVGGFVIMIVMIILRPSPEKIETPKLVPLVKTQILKPVDTQMVIKGYGTVKPKVEVQIVPQVSGRVVSVNPAFRPGGIIPAGEQIFQIEPKDFELMVQQARAKVAEAQVNLETEKSEAAVAKKEWEQVNPGIAPDSALVLREPQIQRAQAALESATAALLKAQLDLERTNITLPINVCITTKNIDLGQYVNAGTSVGTAYGTDVFEIAVPLEDSELNWFNLPGSSAQVKAIFAGGEKIFDGVAQRTTGKVDEKSRFIYVVVEVQNPASYQSITDTLIPGMFVEVNILGKSVADIYVLQRDWIRNANELWLVDNGILRIKTVDILRTDDKYAYLKIDQPQIEVVTSSIDSVVDGMRVRVASEGKNE